MICSVNLWFFRTTITFYPNIIYFTLMLHSSSWSIDQSFRPRPRSRRSWVPVMFSLLAYLYKLYEQQKGGWPLLHLYGEISAMWFRNSTIVPEFLVTWGVKQHKYEKFPSYHLGQTFFHPLKHVTTLWIVKNRLSRYINFSTIMITSLCSLCFLLDNGSPLSWLYCKL